MCSANSSRDDPMVLGVCLADRQIDIMTAVYHAIYPAVRRKSGIPPAYTAADPCWVLSRRSRRPRVIATWLPLLSEW